MTGPREPIAASLYPNALDARLSSRPKRSEAEGPAVNGNPFSRNFVNTNLPPSVSIRVEKKRVLAAPPTLQPQGKRNASLTIDL